MADLTTDDLSETTDGRSMRKERSRQAVVDAILALLAQGVAQPTAQQIADASGVSLRSIFRIFDDIEAVHATAAATQAERIASLLVPLATDGDVDARIDALVTNRLQVFDSIAAVRRYAIRLAPKSPRITSELARSTSVFRSQVAEVFAMELGRLAPHERDVLLDALDVALGFETYDALRSGRGSSPERTREAMALTIRSLVTAPG
jgi:AcrR family transcriptional regulator